MINAIVHNSFRILGVYSNSSQKEIIANYGKLSAFLKVGKDVSFPIDLNNNLPAIIRTMEMVEQAKSDTSLPMGRIYAGQFWFIKQTPIDEIAFNNLHSGNEDKALDIWSKKEDVSSLQNRVILYLIKRKVYEAMYYAERLYEDYSESLVKIIGGETTIISKEELIKNFLTQLYANNQISVVELQSLISNNTWRSILREQSCQPLLAKIEGAILETEKIKNGSPQDVLKAGVKLMIGTTQNLKRLKAYVGSSDLKYQMIADKLGMQILDCAINYYNKSTDYDSAFNAIELQEYAAEIVEGTMAKERCHKNLNILKECISKLPPKEETKAYSAIMKELDEFDKSPQALIHSVKLLECTKPHIDILKARLGSTNVNYLRMSTQVVSKALNVLVAEVNKAISSSDNMDESLCLVTKMELKYALMSAKTIIRLMDKFDLEDDFNHSYQKNRASIVNMYNKIVARKVEINSTVESDGSSKEVNSEIEKDEDTKTSSKWYWLLAVIFAIILFVSILRRIF